MRGVTVRQGMPQNSDKFLLTRLMRGVTLTRTESLMIK